MKDIMNFSSVPGHLVIAFKDGITEEEAAAFLEQFAPMSATFDFRDHPQMGALRRCDLHVEPDTVEDVKKKLQASGLIWEVVHMLRVEYTDQPPEPPRIKVTDKPKEKLDHEWVAKQLGAEIVGKVEGPIHGMAGVENLTRIYQKRMKELRDADEGNQRGSDGSGPGGAAGGEEAGH